MVFIDPPLENREMSAVRKSRVKVYYFFSKTPVLQVKIEVSVI